VLGLASYPQQLGELTPIRGLPQLRLPPDLYPEQAAGYDESAVFQVPEQHEDELGSICCIDVLEPTQFVAINNARVCGCP